MHQDDPQPMCCWPRRARRSKTKAKAKRGTAVPSHLGAAASTQGGSGKTTPLLQAVAGQSSHLPPTKPIQVKSPPSPGELEQVASPLSIADFHDCREDFSVVADGDSQSGLSPHGTPGHSPRTSLTHGQSGKAATAAAGGSDAARLDMAAHTNGTSAGAGGRSVFSDSAQQQPEHEQDGEPGVERQQSFCSTDAPAGASESSEDTPLPLGSSKRTGVVGCLAILDSIRHGSLGATAPEEQLKSQRSKKVSKGLGKPDAGCSIPPRDFSLSVLDVREQCEDAPATTFQVRSQDYMRTKLKVKSSGAMYRLVAADVFTFPQRQFHIAKLVNLPPAPAVRHLLSGDTHIPPLLIFNLQLPLYPATLFGSNDGVGHSIVYYFALPEDFDPATFENQKALSLFKRFVQNGREADGSMTRDRLKLIPRVANPDEWCQKGPLSTSEHKLLVTYNDKPILTRPQHAFFKGANYLEVDLDIHSYAFLARKALGSFIQRLKEVVFENAFVIQGNAVDELPEQILGVARMYRVDLTRQRPFDSFVPRSVAPIAEEAGGQAGESGGAGRDEANANGTATPANGTATPANGTATPAN